MSVHTMRTISVCENVDVVIVCVGTDYVDFSCNVAAGQARS